MEALEESTMQDTNLLGRTYSPVSQFYQQYLALLGFGKVPDLHPGASTQSWNLLCRKVVLKPSAAPGVQALPCQPSRLLLHLSNTAPEALSFRLHPHRQPCHPNTPLLKLYRSTGGWHGEQHFGPPNLRSPESRGWFNIVSFIPCEYYGNVPTTQQKKWNPSPSLNLSNKFKCFPPMLGFFF